MAAKTVGGETLLYSYLQRELQTEDIFLFQMVTARLVTSLGIWFHPEHYRVIPVVLPHVVRDATARKVVGGEELWSTPNSQGFVRDDNTLIKNLVGSLEIGSPRPSLNKKRIGKGWVACHIWLERSDGGRASRHHLTNSFIPNLVWLPKALSLLSDRADSFVQHYLQALSRKIYGHIEVPHPAVALAEDAWAALPPPANFPEAGLPDPALLNYFAPNDAWLQRRQATISGVRRGLEVAANGGIPKKSDVGHTRYRDGLPLLAPDATQALRDLLSTYEQAWSVDAG